MRANAISVMVLALSAGCGRIGYSPLSPGGGGAGGAEGGAGGSGMAGADGGAIADGGAVDATVTDAGAGCAAFTFGGHDYDFCTTKLAWADAESDCEAKGMRLVRIDDASENGWVETTILAVTGSTSSFEWPWIGATDQAIAGDWRWTDGDLFWRGGPNGAAQGGLYANWGSGRPNDSGSAGRCAILEHSTYWLESDCASVQPYVCERY